MERAYLKRIISDLSRKMVFITGPRQVGKTWLAKRVAEHYSSPVYLNYDSYEDQEIIRDRSWPRETDLLILDEIHKMPDWKIYLKGLFDTRLEEQVLVTGSARLETFKGAGESLAGRYFSYRLFPFTLAELGESSDEIFERLLKRGGFPEPYYADDDHDAKRWRRQYSQGLIREDVLDFE